MKQIKFQPELINKPGITVKVNGEVPKYIEYVPKKESEFNIAIVESNGYADMWRVSKRLTMFRAIRSAEDIVRDYLSQTKSKLEQYHPASAKMFIELVQAGMDEVTNTSE